MTVDEIIRLVCLSVSLLISLIGFVATFVKGLKTKKWDELKTELLKLILHAETFSTISGTEKKNMVLTLASQFCKTHSIKFNDEKVEKEIEEILTLIKDFESKENKDKVSEPKEEK